MADSSGQSICRFGDFVLDTGNETLRTAGGVHIPLRPRSFALLRLMTESPGRLLTREALLASLWPNLSVTDDSLTQCIHDVRRAIGDAGAQMLRTAPRRGYVLAVEVRRNSERLPEHVVANPPPTPSIGTIRRTGIFPTPWHESKAGRAIRSWAVAKVLTLGR